MVSGYLYSPVSTRSLMVPEAALRRSKISAIDAKYIEERREEVSGVYFRSRHIAPVLERQLID